MVGVCQYVGVSGSELCCLGQRSTWLFPADHATIRLLHQGQQASSSHVCVYQQHDDHVMGLSPSPMEAGGAAVFWSSFEDGARVVAQPGPAFPRKPDRLGSVLLSYTVASSGLVLTAGSDGSVRMDWPALPQDPCLPPAAQQEAARTIQVGAGQHQLAGRQAGRADGWTRRGGAARCLPYVWRVCLFVWSLPQAQGSVVVRYLRSGGVQVLRADGSVSERASGGARHVVHTHPDGRRSLSVLPKDHPALAAHHLQGDGQQQHAGSGSGTAAAAGVGPRGQAGASLLLQAVGEEDDESESAADLTEAVVASSSSSSSSLGAALGGGGEEDEAPDLSPLPCSQARDPSSGALVSLMGGVLVVRWPSGLVLTRHADGTCFRTSPADNKTRVDHMQPG